MEDDDPTPRALPRWVELEYKHMCTLAGSDASIAFTHLSSAAAAALSTALPRTSPAPVPVEEAPGTARAECHEQGVLALMQVRGIAPEHAPQALAPSDGDAGAFTWFLFGVRDDPPRDRTAELRALGFPTRHLGSVQMTTDTALGVTKRVVVDRVPLDEIPYVDYPTIRFNARESVEMPFRYMIAPGTKDEPLLPPGMKAHLHADLDQSFDF
ncbi:hypothetical protein BJY52DRAFT_1425569 [Lactarius psammicola]|nr:hypothetical protein BJY52DRAFT_1425569 [Lactarius psammicola]